MIHTRISLWIGLTLLLSSGHASAQKSAPRRLTPENLYFMQPVWSPTGEWIAMTGENYDGIWVMRPDGSEVRQVTDDRATGYKMKWSPDGTRLVGRMAKFENRRRYSAIKAYDVESRASWQLSDFRTLLPALPQWADNGNRVMLLADRGLEVFDLPATNKAGATEAVERVLAFDGHTGLFVSSSSSPRAKQIASLAGIVVNAEVAAATGKIVCEVAGEGLYICEADGSGLIFFGEGERPHWSPDGQQLAYMIASDDGEQIENADIFIMRADGSTKRNLTATLDRLEMNCSWAPDGKRLVFDERRSGAIWMVEVGEQ